MHASRESSSSCPSPLINFDKKTIGFLLILFATYLLFGALKIHTSNIAFWDLYFGKQKSEAVIVGTPRFIRMDEWVMLTPSAMSQYALGLPLENPSIGGGSASLVFGLPVKDISMVLKPSTWPYYVFDMERAFAFSWNFNVFFFVAGMFLLLMLLTKNNFWLSFAGAFFIFFSAGIQWWSYFLSIPMAYLNGIVISFIYLLYSVHARSFIVASLTLCICSFSFLSFLYPAFQVPLVYLYALVLLGYFLREKNFQLIAQHWKTKSAIAGIFLVILCVVLVHYFSLAKDTFETMMNTAYPGKRVSNGGDLVDGKLFADFFGLFMTDSHVPKLWQNICEVSAGVMYFPIIFYGLAYHFFRHRKTDWLLVSLSGLVLLLLAYILLGFSPWLSKVSLFASSTSYRALPVLGVANSILLICFLGSNRVRFRESDFSWLELFVLSAAILVFMLTVSSNINQLTGNFFTGLQVTLATAIIVITYLLARYKDLKFATPVLCAMLLLTTVHNVAANPLTRGLGPLLNNPLTLASGEVNRRDPGFGWAVFGTNKNLPQLLKPNGIYVFNGIKLVPPLEKLRVLDPARQYEPVYNRYAWVTMQSYIDSKDSVIFQQDFTDAYNIFIDPCSPRLTQLGVKYFVFTYQPKEVEVRCMTRVGVSSPFPIYASNNSFDQVIGLGQGSKGPTH